MELLYLLLGIIGLLCFYYCVKYIFRDTNKQYYYKDIYPKSEIIEHLEIQPTMPYDYTPISDIDEFDTIIISDINNLKHLPRREKAAILTTRKYIGIYNKISIYELTCMIHLNPINRESDFDVTETRKQLLSKLNFAGAKPKPNDFKIYYKTPDEVESDIIILVFQTHQENNYTLFITDYTVADKKKSVTHHGARVSGEEGKHINIVNENDQIYKDMFISNVQNISKKHLYSTFRFNIIITPSHTTDTGTGIDDTSSDMIDDVVSEGAFFMYGLNKNNEMYNVTDNNYTMYNLYTRFEQKPSTIFIEDNFSNKITGKYDNQRLENAIQTEIKDFMYFSIHDKKANEIIKSIKNTFDKILVLGEYTFYKSTNNSFIYLNDKFNSYIKFTLKNKFVSKLPLEKKNDVLNFPNIDNDIDEKLKNEKTEEMSTFMQNKFNYDTVLGKVLNTSENTIHTTINEYNNALNTHFNINIGLVFMETPIPSGQKLQYIDYVDKINTGKVYFADWVSIEPRSPHSPKYKLHPLDKLYAMQTNDQTHPDKHSPQKQPEMPNIYIQYYFENIDIEYKVYYFSTLKPESNKSILNHVFNIINIKTNNISELVNRYINHTVESEEEFNTSIVDDKLIFAIDINEINTKNNDKEPEEEEEEDLIYNTSVHVSNTDDMFGFIHSNQTNKIYTLRIPSDIDSSEHYDYYRLIKKNISPTQFIYGQKQGITLYLKKYLFNLVEDEDEDDDKMDDNLMTGSFCEKHPLLDFCMTPK